MRTAPAKAGVPRSVGMKIYHAQPLTEFLDNVRFQAASASAPWQLIEKLDEVRAVVEEYDEDAISEARAEGYEEAEKECEETIRGLENEVDSLRDQIRDLNNQLDTYAEGRDDRR